MREFSIQFQNKNFFAIVPIIPSLTRLVFENKPLLGKIGRIKTPLLSQPTGNSVAH